MNIRRHFGFWNEGGRKGEIRKNKKKIQFLFRILWYENAKSSLFEPDSSLIYGAYSLLTYCYSKAWYPLSRSCYKGGVTIHGVILDFL